MRAHIHARSPSCQRRQHFARRLAGDFRPHFRVEAPISRYAIRTPPFRPPGQPKHIAARYPSAPSLPAFSPRLRRVSVVLAALRRHYRAHGARESSMRGRFHDTDERCTIFSKPTAAQQRHVTTFARADFAARAISIFFGRYRRYHEK